jgi:hypothetical protein
VCARDRVCWSVSERVCVCVFVCVSVDVRVRAYASVCLHCMHELLSGQITYPYTQYSFYYRWLSKPYPLVLPPLLLSVFLIHGTDSNAACEHHSDATHPRLCRMD